MNRKISLGTAIALMFVVAAVTLSITMLYSRNQFNSTVSNLTEREAVYDKLAEIDNIVRNNYIGEIDEDRLLDGIAYGYMAGISDTYGTYYTAEQYEEIMRSLEGKIVGIGISASRTENGYILVEEVYPDSPAEAAQIQPGELIVKVNDIDLTPETYEEGKNAISGKAGTTLSLVVRNGTEDREITEITRRRVQRPTVYYKAIDKTGYIRITEFNGSTYDQFKVATESLLNSGATSLIFDVRNNPGGTLDSVVKILDMLLPEGDLVTSVDKDGNVEVVGTSDASCLNVPMVVLTNRNTASAAELFTQALKDYGVAKSVGETTYGKGTMQTYHKLQDGSGIRLTTSQYNPPKSPNYDGVGIKPDYEVEYGGDLFSVEIISPEMDAQLKKALDLVAAGGELPEEESDSEETEDPDSEETDTDVSEEDTAEDNAEETDETKAETSEEENTEDSAEDTAEEESTSENTESENTESENTDNSEESTDASESNAA